MCGIAFVLNNDTYATDTDDFLGDALLAGQVRGTDSTGVLVLSKLNVPTIHKMGVNASTFLEDKTSREVMNKVASSRVAIAHVRAATIGNISADNAHPFRAEREDGSYIIGVHNGTLTSWRSLPNAGDFKVDSDWLFHMLAKEGNDAFEYFDGAFALVWIDSREPDQVFMARNDARPLHYMIAENGRSILGCSELGMLGWLSARNKFNCHKDFPTPYYIPAGSIFKFSLTDIGYWDKVDFPKFDRSHLPAQPTPTTFNNGYYRGGYPGNPGYSSRHTNLTPSRTGAYYPDADDHMEGSVWDNYDAAYGSLGGSSWDDTEETIDAVKEALRKARNSTSAVVDENEILGDVALEEAMTAAIGEFLTKEEIKHDSGWFDKVRNLNYGEHSVIDPAAKTATAEEKTNAKSLGLFGTIVKFEGEYYDDELKSCSGNINILENGMLATHSAEIRYLKKAVADDLYINRKAGEGELCVVVGVDKDIEWMILEPLTAEQRQGLTGQQTEKKRTIAC